MMRPHHLMSQGFAAPTFDASGFRLSPEIAGRISADAALGICSLGFLLCYELGVIQLEVRIGSKTSLRTNAACSAPSNTAYAPRRRRGGDGVRRPKLLF